MPSEGATDGDIDLAKSSLSFGGIGIGSCGGCLCGGSCLRLVEIEDREVSLVCRRWCRYRECCGGVGRGGGGFAEESGESACSRRLGVE